MHIIDIRLNEISQLYDSLDPSPFREKALDRDAESYLIESAGEFPPKAEFRVLVHGPLSLQSQVDDIAAGIHTHFRSLSTLALRRHRRRKRNMHMALLLGFTVLAAGLLLRTLVADWPGAVGEVVAEGLLILSWVALWRPAEMALFDEWERRDQLRLLQGLASVPVEFRVVGNAAAP